MSSFPTSPYSKVVFLHALTVSIVAWAAVADRDRDNEDLFWNVPVDKDSERKLAAEAAADPSLNDQGFETQMQALERSVDQNSQKTGELQRLMWKGIASDANSPGNLAGDRSPKLSKEFNAPPPAMATSEAIERSTGLVISGGRLPLRTDGRYIVDRLGGRVKWSCVNWHGGQQRSWVMGGLQKQPVRDLAIRIASLGFNCVRLTYSTEAVVKNPLVPADRLAANTQLIGKYFLDCLDAVVEALTQEHVMIIMNNHLSTAGWCCNINQDEGLWYTAEFDEQAWLNSVVLVADRYKDNLWVVAHDLRNEPHSYHGVQLTWGSGNPKTDYKMAMEKAGNAVLDVAPNTLIVIEGLCFGMELRFIKDSPAMVKLPHKIVYEVHNYQEFQFATLFTSHFYAWSFVRSIIVYVFLWLLLCLLSLSYACVRLRWPWAPKGVFLVTFGSWIVVILAPCLGAAIGAYAYYMKYCNFIAELDIKPYILYLSTSMLLGVVILIGGVHRSGFVLRRTKVDYIASRHTRGIGRTIEMSSDEITTSDEDEDAFDETLEDEDLACFKVFVRAKRRNDGGPCCFRGFRSCRIIFSRTVGKDWRTKKIPRVDWDCGVCLLWQCFCAIPFLLVLLILLWIYAFTAPLYTKIENEFDRKWGFALQDGYNFTAPVWMGEFGVGEKGTYWVNFVRYLSERDIDWAYWPLNPDKLVGGSFDDWGHWHNNINGDSWDEDTYSILNMDWLSVRAPWRLLDLMPLMESPSGPVLNTQPCQRTVLGKACGG